MPSSDNSPAHLQVESSVQGSEASRRRRREHNLALQFAAIGGVFLAVITLFRAFPLAVPAGTAYPFAFVAFLIIANSSLNALVYLGFNTDIRFGGIARPLRP